MDYAGMYQEMLLDHYKNPRHKGIISPANFSSGVFNPSCGDRVSVTGIIKNGIIEQVAFEAQGCVISCAAASLLMERILAERVEVVAAYTPEIMKEFVGIPLGPTRLRCALIVLEAVQKALSEYKERQNA